MFEQIISTKWLQKKPLFAILLGLFYTLIGAVTSYVFFRSSISLSMLFLISILLVPSLMNLLTVGEAREQRSGLRRFFANHKDIFSIYLFLSVGIFIGYLLSIWIFNSLGVDINTTLFEQMRILGDGLSKEAIQAFSTNHFAHALGIWSSNIGVAVILFILSVFYGAGSIFLVVWNASIFSAFIFTTIQKISSSVNASFILLGAFSLYVIPEIAGFLLAAIAGGVVSKAVIVEEFMSARFRNVMRDGFVLLLISFSILLVASFLESYIGVNAIQALV